AHQDILTEYLLLHIMDYIAACLAAVENICAFPCVDGIYVGPSTLAFAVGALPGQPNDAHAEALVRIRTAADTAGVIPGIHCGDGTEAKLRKDQGFRFITSAGDIGAAGRAFREELAAARE